MIDVIEWSHLCLGWGEALRGCPHFALKRMCDMQQPLEPFNCAILPYRMVNMRTIGNMAFSALFAARLKSRFRIAISTL
jgi:hypothetical protein